MKGLACSECVTLRTLTQRDFDPVKCDCGNVTAWWIDGAKGEARFYAKRRETAFGVGLNNAFLLYVLKNFGAIRSPAEWREIHETTCEHAQGYIFHKDARNCWISLFKPGTVAVVEWATPEELGRVGL